MARRREQRETVIEEHLTLLDTAEEGHQFFVEHALAVAAGDASHYEARDEEGYFLPEGDPLQYEQCQCAECNWRWYLDFRAAVKLHGDILARLEALHARAQETCAALPKPRHAWSFF